MAIERIAVHPDLMVPCWSMLNGWPGLVRLKAQTVPKVGEQSLSSASRLIRLSESSPSPTLRHRSWRISGWPIIIKRGIHSTVGIKLFMWKVSLCVCHNKRYELVYGGKGNAYNFIIYAEHEFNSFNLQQEGLAVQVPFIWRQNMLLPGWEMYLQPFIAIFVVSFFK